MARVLWMLKQLLPCTYWTTYTITAGPEDGDPITEIRYFVIWKMWLGRCYDTVNLNLGNCAVSFGFPGET